MNTDWHDSYNELLHSLPTPDTWARVANKLMADVRRATLKEAADKVRNGSWGHTADPKALAAIIADEVEKMEED